MAPTHRERVLKALNNEETDRVPMDFGGLSASRIHPDAYVRLLEHLGFEPERIEKDAATEGSVTSQNVVCPSEQVLEHFGIDVRGFHLGAQDSKPYEILGPNSYVDDWGVTWARVGPTAPFLNTDGPLCHLDDPVPADVDRAPWPAPDDPGLTRGLHERIARARAATDYAICLNLPNATFAISQRVRGFVQLFEDLLVNPVFASAVMDRVTDTLCGFAETALREVGHLVDAVSIGDDMGIQTQAFMSTDLYRRMVKQHHKRYIDAIRRHSSAYVVLHSDGAIFDLIPDLIDAGVQVLNPIQTNAVGMDPERLKSEFGRDLRFWGGIDTQRVLPRGTPDEVAAEVRNRVADLGRGGGYVLASVHNIQAEVPPENIVAMFETARSLST